MLYDNSLKRSQDVWGASFALSLLCQQGPKPGTLYWTKSSSDSKLLWNITQDKEAEMRKECVQEKLGVWGLWWATAEVSWGCWCVCTGKGWGMHRSCQLLRRVDPLVQRRGKSRSAMTGMWVQISFRGAGAWSSQHAATQTDKRTLRHAKKEHFRGPDPNMRRWMSCGGMQGYRIHRFVRMEEQIQTFKMFQSWKTKLPSCLCQRSEWTQLYEIMMWICNLRAAAEKLLKETMP